MAAPPLIPELMLAALLLAGLVSAVFCIPTKAWAWVGTLEKLRSLVSFPCLFLEGVFIPLWPPGPQGVLEASRCLLEWAPAPAPPSIPHFLRSERKHGGDSFPYPAGWCHFNKKLSFPGLFWALIPSSKVFAAPSMLNQCLMSILHRAAARSRRKNGITLDRCALEKPPWSLSF